MTLPFKTHPKLTTRHGFFGRRGGVSEGPYESLNTGLHSGDDKASVEINRTRVAQALNTEDIISLSQIHSDQVEIITEKPTQPLEADGLVTCTKNLALSVLSADCGPVLLHDPFNEVIGACHAGWKGAVGGIIENTVAAMCEIGASPASIEAVLGPCISQENYEVGHEFKSNILEFNFEIDGFFENNAKGIPHFNLPHFILSRLYACGIEKADWMGDCTYRNDKEYFSYRRNTHEGIKGYGRNISVIILN